MQIGIVAQRGNPRAASLADSLRDVLADRDVSVRIDEATATALETVGSPVSTVSTCDLVVSIGGDGTFLFAARNADGTPILGINLGEVGFLNAVSPSNAESAVVNLVDAFEDDEMTVRETPRLTARVDGWESNPAANEIVVQGPRRGHGGGIDYDIRIDGSLYSGSHADGVLFATPTGSTAYNLSEGGPIVHPAVDAVVVNEMCAQEGMPPLTIGFDSTISVTITGTDEAIVISDGREPRTVETPTTVDVSRSPIPMRIAGPQPNFFEALEKLS